MSRTCECIERGPDRLLLHKVGLHLSALNTDLAYRLLTTSAPLKYLNGRKSSI